MRNLILLGLLIAASGCGTTSEHTLVNNTPYILKVTINAEEVYPGVVTGQVVPIHPSFLQQPTEVVATAWDGTNYVGVATQTFYLNTPESWVVSVQKDD